MVRIIRVISVKPIQWDTFENVGIFAHKSVIFLEEEKLRTEINSKIDCDVRQIVGNATLLSHKYV